MIEYHNKTTETIVFEKKYTDWVISLLTSEDKTDGDICFILCNDDYLLEINREHLDHDYYTDIITFDYSVGDKLSGDILISLDRVKENSRIYGVQFIEELRRVMAHGVLHLMGYQDGTSTSKREMRAKEEKALKMFHVEQ
ncbi:rRNA maturation RNase YbeY [Eudoraea chungangensis]|uniref:rRNA maturation RNase YbeY n=1 Tax=Eudoraea chungangensis TaxID=1481905 RepID=UPI0023EB2BA7|nr:rRNA maturation RNase YbeY [Eudoraea chungangensis]